MLLTIAVGIIPLGYLTAVPGVPHTGPLPSLTAEETALAASLKRHIETVAA